MVALLVCRERLRKDSSFADYLDSLPTCYPTMPLLDAQPPWDALGNLKEHFSKACNCSPKTPSPCEFASVLCVIQILFCK